ncbi:MAG: metallophosphoesterase [Anaerolineaceae bacterium]
MEGKNKIYRLFILSLLLGLVLLSCRMPLDLGQSVVQDPIVPVHLVTMAPNASPTYTPFQPVPNTPTITPSPTPTQTPTPTLTPTPTITMTPTVTDTPEPQPDILVGAGDISKCDQDGDNHTSELLASIPGEIYTLGDNSNDSGSPEQYSDCFDYSWGRYMARLHPVPGNHDYFYNGGTSYFDYFGATAGEFGKGYYSYDVGTWHVIAINSLIGIDAESPQAQWLRDDLAAHPALCTLAYWHYPRWSSGTVGNYIEMDPIIRILYDHNVDIVLSGHDHIYERFSPQNPDGALDPLRGIREFIVGTGGATHHGFGEIKANSEVRNNDTFGVLEFLLYPDGYTWEFIPVKGSSFTDSGFEYCH